MAKLLNLLRRDNTQSWEVQATTKTKQKYSDVKYEENDFIMFGPESRGIPEEILNTNPERCITIPMIPMGRSLNLSNSAVIILYEAYRQLGFNF